MDILKAIPSRDMREYVRQNNYTFTDMQKAVIIYHSLLPSEEKTDMLQELKGETTDDELRAQLSQYLTYAEKAKRVFADNSQKNYVYKVIFTVEDYNKKTGFYDEYEDIHEGCFLRLEDAVRYAMHINNTAENKSLFRIEKNPLFDNVSDFNDIYAENPIAVAYYNETGKMMDLDEYEIPENEQYHEDSSNFTYKYVEMPNPFELGDIVEYMSPYRKAKKIHIVNTSQEVWMEYRERIERTQEKAGWDFSDVALTESVLCDNGIFSHCHENPMYMQRVELPDTDPRKVLIEVASNTIKGRSSLDWLQYYTAEYLKRINHKECVS